MKRGGSFRRKAPLRNRQGIDPTAPGRLRIAPRAGISIHRKPLRKVGSVKAREKAAIVAFREALMARAGDHCERCGCMVGETRLEPDHIVRRSRCIGWPFRHDPSVNGLACCHACHRARTLDPLDIGGPTEADARVAHRMFQEWRSQQGFTKPIPGNPGPGQKDSA